MSTHDQDDAHEDTPDDAVRTTHSGTVWLTGDRAYKFKRPVRLAFLDFSTLEARHAACVRELELNRRLAPDVYLGLGALSSPQAEPEPCVVMHRLPDDRRLATLLRSGVDVEGYLKALAHTVAAFHACAQRSPEIDRSGDGDALRERWRANLAELAPHVGTHIDAGVVGRIEELVEGFLAGRDALWRARITQGRIVDGHGDLLAQDIFCLDDGPRALDCLDFDDRLRHLDVLDDVGCLAMDIERLADAWTADRWVQLYAEMSADPAPRSLVDHYVAYRALMRAKVGCLPGAAGRHDQPAEDSPEAHCRIALAHLERAEVRLVLVGGTPGTGKTTLAGAVADRNGWVSINSDRVRKELAGLDPTSPSADHYGHGIYTAAWDERTYAELLRRASTLLGLGESVILDASWNALGYRHDAARLATTAGASLVAVRCTAPVDVAEARIQNRVGVSDADAVIAHRMHLRAAPWPEAHDVDTTGPLEDIVDGLAETLGTRGGPHTRGSRHDRALAGGTPAGRTPDNETLTRAGHQDPAAP